MYAQHENINRKSQQKHVFFFTFKIIKQYL